MIGARWRVVLIFLLFVGTFAFASPPAHYVENKNQWPKEFLFGADFPQMKVLAKDASIFFVQHSFVSDARKSGKQLNTGNFDEGHLHADGELQMSTFELTFIDALHPSIVTSDKQITTYNYFTGNDASKWATKAASYGEVRYNGMYNGIDLKLYSQDNQMKYDWIVAPCGDAGKIHFAYKGVDNIMIRDKNLVIETVIGEVVETKPYAYQMVNGEQRRVNAAFELDDNIVSFVFPEGYDANYELVIDPFLIFSTYSGSTYDNWGNTATPDSRGNLYSGGMVDNTLLNDGIARSFPTTPGAFQTTHHGDLWDIGILKYDSSGANVLYATYLGGKGTETPQSLVVNSNDELLILGATSSSDFPGTSGGFKGGPDVTPLNGVSYSSGTDIFIARLSSDGSTLLASTYLGGAANDGINFISGNIDISNPNNPNVKRESPLSRNYGDQFRGDIITTPDGSVYIASNTRSSDFPLINTDPGAAWHGGSHDAVVAKLNPNLSLVWSRLVGGDSTDVAFSIKINSLGNIVVAGGTASTNLAGMNGLRTTAPGGTDGWIAEISPNGDQIINGTYVGTSAYDQVYFIDFATNGDLVAYGQTKGNYPHTAGVYGRAQAGQFIHKFTANLKATVFSTTFGNGGLNPDISPTAFMVNNCDNIYIAGWGGSINDPFYFPAPSKYYVGGTTIGLPVTADAWQKTSSGNDFYLMILDNNGANLVYSTFLGGRRSLTHVDGGTSRFDKKGVVYHAVCANCGGLTNDFPTYNVPPSRAFNSSYSCTNAAFKFDLVTLRAGLVANSSVCFPNAITIQNTSHGGELFEWDYGDGSKEVFNTKTNVNHKYAKPGTYTVKLTVTDPTTCIGKDVISTVVYVFLPNMHATDDQAICAGSSAMLSGTGALTYEWEAKSSSFTRIGNYIPVSPETSETYYVTMTDQGGCTRRDTVNVRVVPKVDVKFDFEQVYDCVSRPYVKLVNTGDLKEGQEATFSFGDGSTSDEKEVTHNYQQDGIYTISLRGVNEFCAYEVSKQLPFVTLKIPNVITPGKEDGLNDSFKIVYGTPPFSKSDLKISLKIFDRWGKGVYQSDDYQDDWTGANVEGGVYFFEVVMLGDLRCKGWVHLIK